MKKTPSQSYKEDVETMNLNRNEVKSAVIGMVIGDGSISLRDKNNTGKVNAYLQINHSDNQLDYLLWKKDIISNITESTVNKVDYISSLDNKPYKMYHLGTRRHPVFTKLYKRFYHDKHKVVDEHLVKMITPLALAIMYMDDGTRSNFGNRSDSFFLCTQSFDYANQLLIKKSLKIKFDLDWNINRVGTSKSGNVLYRLRLANRHNQKFIDIIRSYIEQVPCMIYKLGSYANTSK